MLTSANVQGFVERASPVFIKLSQNPSVLVLIPGHRAFIRSECVNARVLPDSLLRGMST